MIRAVLACLMLAAPAVAEETANASAGEVRVLDKITGTITDLTLTAGESKTVGLLTVRLGECRYPVSNPSGDAYGELSISYQGADGPVFEGWMLASSPALNAMDHPRYDVWMLRCITS